MTLVAMALTSVGSIGGLQLTRFSACSAALIAASLIALFRIAPAMLIKVLLRPDSGMLPSLAAFAGDGPRLPLPGFVFKVAGSCTLSSCRASTISRNGRDAQGCTSLSLVAM